MYLNGFMDGGSSALLEFFNEKKTEEMNARVHSVMKETALRYDLDVLRDVMTDLYRDPANVFITFSLYGFCRAR